ncbi:MAG: DUF1415 domain-containing protein [Burkholderiales bacterium]
MADAAAVRANTQRWLERAVIGLNLCPFAKAVHANGQIHYAVSAASSADALLTALEAELIALLAHEPQERDTTLLIAPAMLAEFADFNDFLELANIHLRLLALQGQVQLASFHPNYQFQGTAADDIANATNRAPYPMLHLLREASVSRALQALPHANRIVERNVQTLRELGHAGWQALGVGRGA